MVASDYSSSQTCRPRGRPRKHYTAEERRIAKNISQQKYKMKKRCHTVRGPCESLHTDQAEGERSLSSTGSTQEVTVDSEYDTTQPAEPLTNSSESADSALLLAPQAVTTRVSVALSPSPPSLAATPHPQAVICATLSSTSLPEFEHRHSVSQDYRLADVEGELARLQEKLKELREYQSEHEWAKKDCENSLIAMALGHVISRTLNVQRAYDEALALESQAAAVCRGVSDLDPSFQHPLTVRCMMVWTSIDRCRRILQEEKLMLASGRLADRFKQGKLVWQRVWDTMEEYKDKNGRVTEAVASESVRLGEDRHRDCGGRVDSASPGESEGI